MSTSDDGPRLHRRSPFLLAGWEGRDMVLLNCDSLRRFRVDQRVLSLLTRLDVWTSQEELPSGLLASSEDLTQLGDLGVVEDELSNTCTDEAGYWSPFDLMVQRQQNVGGEVDADERSGPPPPAFKPRPTGATTGLPPAGALPGQLDDVLRTRKSIRTYGRQPMSLQALSALLHHSARVTGTLTDASLGEQVFRPFPGGGARSELEIYVVANDVERVTTGVHYYDARSHELVQLREPGEDQRRLNRWAADAIGGDPSHNPQVVLLITAVFARVMWKYRGIGLGLIYRDVGCLYQTLYLVANALGLAPCAIGGGTELANARWLGLDPLVESQVGCFLIGTREAL